MPSLPFSSNDRTRRNDMKLAQSHVRYDIGNQFFTHRLVNLWNSQPAHDSSVNDFKNKLDAHRSNQEMVYNLLSRNLRNRKQEYFAISCIS